MLYHIVNSYKLEHVIFLGYTNVSSLTKPESSPVIGSMSHHTEYANTKQPKKQNKNK